MSRTRIVKGNITKIIGGNYKRYSKDDIVKVIATKNRLMEKVGEIKILPNAKYKKVEILLIPVEYRKSSGSIKNSEEINYLNNVLFQSLIIAKIETYNSKFQTGSWWSDLFFTTKNEKGDKFMDLSSMRSLHRYLDDDFMSIEENKKYRDYCRVYFLPNSLKLNGVSEGIGNTTKTVVVFQNRDNFTTLVHEILHSMGLHHTFDNNSKYTFELYNTDNVMDYTHHVRGKDRFTTNKFQWKILNENI